MISSNITVARIPPVMTTVPAVIRMALHQHPAENDRRERMTGRGQREREGKRAEDGGEWVKGEMKEEKAHNSSVQWLH